MKMRVFSGKDEQKQSHTALLRHAGLSLSWANVSKHGDAIVEILIDDLIDSGIFNLTDGSTPGRSNVLNNNPLPTTANKFSLSDCAALTNSQTTQAPLSNGSANFSLALNTNPSASRQEVIPTSLSSLAGAASSLTLLSSGSFILLVVVFQVIFENFN